MLELTKARTTTGFVDFRVRVPDAEAEKLYAVLQAFISGLEKILSHDDEKRAPWAEMFPDTHPGVILRGAREMENLTQAGLAAKIHVTRNNISAMETGKRRITIDMAKRLAKALGCEYKIFL